MSILADIVIVNWNSGDLLGQCLQSIRDFPAGVGKVVVVDNGSNDGSANLATLPPNVEIVAAGGNLGFAKACNRGAARCTSPYILFLNPDARLLEDGLSRVIAFMESDAGKHYGICGVRLEGREGEVQRHCTVFSNVAIYFGHATGLNRVFPKIFPPHFMLDFDHLSSRPVDVVIGAYFFVRRQLFENLGGFDERFFVYYEEVDFALRACQAGWPAYYLADAKGFHHGGGTSENVKAHRLFYSLRSRILYVLKHFSWARAWAVVAISLVIEPLTRLLRAALRLSKQEFSDTAYGCAMLWGDVPRILAAKREYGRGKGKLK